MAIIDKTKKPNPNDRNENIFLGIDLPFELSDGPEGWFSSTSLTIDAVKNNIKSLLTTERGERLMQPNLGLNLRKYLFEQIFDDEVIINIQNEVVDTIRMWLPMVIVRDIEVSFREVSNIHTLYLNVKFGIAQDPTTLEELGIEITGE